MKEANNSKEILEKMKKASNENYETTWDEKGVPHSKKKSEIKKGKSSRAQGAQFELRARKDLESKGWVIDKWSNNIDLENNSLGPAKRVYNPFKKALVIGTGFPDFIAIKNLGENLFRVVGVEVKMNGLLSKTEKEKCAWYLKNKIFSEIWIAVKEKEGRKIKIKYENFSERYPSFNKS